jgi:hypothetical protein
MSDEKALANLEKLVSRLAPSYLEATKRVLAKADRATATQAELRSARGLTVGAALGFAICSTLAQRDFGDLTSVCFDHCRGLCRGGLGRYAVSGRTLRPPA